MHVSVADWITVISLLVAVEMAIGHGTVSLTNAVPDSWVPRIQAWCNILAFIGSSIVAALSRMVTAFLVIAVLLALAGGSAFAQDRTPTPRPSPSRIGGPAGQVLDNLGVKPLPGPAQGGDDGAPSTSSQPGNGFTSPLDKPFQDLANFIGDDIDAAITLATSLPALQDGNGQKCLMALKTFGDVIKAHPAPLTFKIATDLEAFRLKQMAINRLCQEPACTVVFADITQTITAAAAIPLPIPSLHDLCGKVPQIAVAPPVSVAPAPVPASAPAAPANP